MTDGQLEAVTFGECLISFRSSGPLSAGGPFSMHLAGAEANVAVGLARLGHRVAWVGRVSDDELGTRVTDGLAGQGVDTSFVRRDPTRSAGMMVLERRTADHSRVTYNRRDSAGSAIGRADLATAVAPGLPLLHLTGITPALSESAREATLTTAATAGAAGTTVSLDVNYRAGLWDRDTARRALRDVATHADVIIASDDELDLVTAAGDDEERAVATLLARGVSEIVVKRGVHGATVFTADGRIDQSAVPVTAVDTVGAGDAFCAGYLSGRLDGLPPSGRAARGAAVAAFCVATVGDWDGLPRRDELSLLGDAPGTTRR